MKHGAAPDCGNARPVQAQAKVEGVGLGAEAAALAYADFDEATLATWKPGEPVPFSLLAATLNEMQARLRHSMRASAYQIHLALPVVIIRLLQIHPTLLLLQRGTDR